MTAPAPALPAPAAVARPALPRWSGMRRVLEREIAVFRRLWRGMAMSATVTPLMFLGAMGVGLGSLIDSGGGSAVAGSTYLEFLAPGLLAATLFQNAANAAMWPVMAGTTWIRSFHGMVATPITAAEVFGGYLIFATVFRGLVTAVPFVVVAALLGAFPSAWAVMAVPASLLGGMAIAAPLMAYAGAQDVDSGFVVLNRVGIMPLFLFSGTFFPVEQLPGWLQPAAVVSPLWHAAELARGAAFASLDLLTALLHVAVLLAFVGIGARWGMRTFTRKLTP